MRLRSLNPLVWDLVRRMAAALPEPASAHPNDDGYLLLNGFPGTPDVEIQAILALGICVLKLRHQLPKSTRPVAGLETDGFVGFCVGMSVVGRSLGRHKAEIPKGGATVRDTDPLVYIGARGVDKTRVSTAGGFDSETTVGSFFIRISGPY